MKSKGDNKEKKDDLISVSDTALGCVVFIIIGLYTYDRNLAVLLTVASAVFYIINQLIKKRFVSKSYIELMGNEEELKNKVDTLQEEINKLNSQKKEAETFLISRDMDAILDKETTVDFTDNVTSDEIKNQLAVYKVEEKNMIKTIVTVEKYTKANTHKQLKQLLRAFNAEADYYTSNVTPRNVDTYRKRLTNSFHQLNKLFEIDGVALSTNYLKLKLKQLSIIYQYQIKLEEERELLKVQKEEIREQQKVEKELANARRKIEKEERQFNNELKKMFEYMSKANNDIERKIYADKIKELEEKVKQLEIDKEDVEKRQLNTRAGFVYIISNIGSFGENIYKIGMTRRLEPMDRIKELSSASVPFEFDVHALIFSEDAPSLEALIHQHFRAKEVNKVNSRKEFFKVDLDEIKELVHEKYDKTVNFIDEADAIQYRETLKILNNELQNI